MPFTQTRYDMLAGTLIGLARATEGNEDLVTESTHRAMLNALSLAPDADENTLSETITLLREEKRKLVPGCFDCAMPCGRTSDFDMRALANEEKSLRIAKYELLAQLRTLATHTRPSSQTIPYFYEALCFIGYDYATVEQIQNIKEKLYRKT